MHVSRSGGQMTSFCPGWSNYVQSANAPKHRFPYGTRYYGHNALDLRNIASSKNPGSQNSYLAILNLKCFNLGDIIREI